jgi:heptosyltransferase-2
LKPTLLVLELWGLGDLAIATVFLRTVSEYYDVSLLAKPVAHELQPSLWPNVKIISFTAPWTSFSKKYHVWKWPWREIWRVENKLLATRYDFGVSARWDPRDHALLALSRSKMRLGFGRSGSGYLLTCSLERNVARHRYDDWKALAAVLNVEMPAVNELSWQTNPSNQVVVHSGAAHPIRVWPLDNYLSIVERLRGAKHNVLVVCDPGQKEWWQRHGQVNVATPSNATELLTVLSGAGLFVGNDSGPGHLAAAMGIETFTIFGNNLPEYFLPVHPHATWNNGKPCIYKPCFDKCRYPSPFCITTVHSDEVWEKLESLMRQR